MRKMKWLIVGVLILALSTAVGCSCKKGEDVTATPDPNETTGIKVIGIDVNGDVSDVYDPAAPEATFPPENVIADPAATLSPNVGKKPQTEGTPVPEFKDGWNDGEEMEGDAAIVDGLELFG